MRAASLAAALLLSAVARAELPATLTLEEALREAAARQPALRQARAAQEVSTARAREALAPMLPTVSLGLAYSRATANFSGRPGSVPSSLSGASPLSLAASDYWSGNLNASVLVWDFGQTWSRYLGALSTVEAQAAQAHAQEVAVALQVRTAWYTALAQAELVEVAKATLTNTAAHLAQVRGYVEVGSRPEIDLAQSRAEQANARLALVTAQNGAALARARLCQAIGLEGPAAFEVVGAPGVALEGEELSPEVLYQEALGARPEVAALEAQVRTQESVLLSVRGASLPSLGASLGTTVGAQSLAAPVPNLSGGLTLNWGLYQGGLTTAQEAEQRAALAVLAAQRQGLLLQVRLDVEQARLQVVAARETVGVAQEALDAAHERLRLAEGRYRSGAGSALELGDARLGHANAAAQRVNAVYGLATARAQLAAALGRR